MSHVVFNPDKIPDTNTLMQTVPGSGYDIRMLRHFEQEAGKESRTEKVLPERGFSDVAAKANPFTDIAKKVAPWVKVQTEKARLLCFTVKEFRGFLSKQFASYGKQFQKMEEKDLNVLLGTLQSLLSQDDIQIYHGTKLPAGAAENWKDKTILLVSSRQRETKAEAASFVLRHIPDGEAFRNELEGFAQDLVESADYVCGISKDAPEEEILYHKAEQTLYVTSGCGFDAYETSQIFDRFLPFALLAEEQSEEKRPQTEAYRLTSVNYRPLVEQLNQPQSSVRPALLFLKKSDGVYPFQRADECQAALEPFADVYVASDDGIGYIIQAKTALEAEDGTALLHLPNQEPEKVDALDASALLNALYQKYYRQVQVEVPRYLSVLHQSLKETQKQESEEHLSELYEEEIAGLKQRLSQMSAELTALEQQNHGLRQKLETAGEKKLFQAGEDADLYEDETYEIIVDILTGIAKDLPQRTRRKDVLDSFLKANPALGILANKKTALDKVANETSYEQKVRLLDEAGFQCDTAGKHVKLTYEGDPRYVGSMSKTPSDFKSMQNMTRELRKQCF